MTHLNTTILNSWLPFIPRGIIKIKKSKNFLETEQLMYLRLIKKRSFKFEKDTKDKKKDTKLHNYF